MSPMEFCYRVRSHADGTWKVHVMFPPPHIGEEGWGKEYKDFEALPEVLREKVAVLQLVGGDGDEEVKGVGKRHASVPPTFWIYTDRDILT